METVSQLLGHKKTEVTQRHYNKWILERQQNIRLLRNEGGKQIRAMFRVPEHRFFVFGSRIHLVVA